MPISNYPKGFAGGVSLRNVPLYETFGGNVYWVSSTGGADTGKGSKDKPFASINYAVTRCVAGDTILVKPTHVETLTAAGSLTTGTAGVTIIGLGTGAYRPVILWDAAAATLAVTAANVTLQNFILRASFADVTTGINVTATNFSLLGCKFEDEAVNLNFVDYVTCSGAANTANGLTIVGCSVIGVDTAIDQVVKFVDDVDGFVFNDNFISLMTADRQPEAVIECATGKDLTNCQIIGNHVYMTSTAGDLFINNDTTANSGIVAYNRIGHADTALETLIDCDGVRLFDNTGTAIDTGSGYLLPAVDS